MKDANQVLSTSSAISKQKQISLNSKCQAWTNEFAESFYKRSKVKVPSTKVIQILADTVTPEKVVELIFNQEI